MNQHEGIVLYDIQNTGEADAGVRDSAFESVGMLWKCLGEKHILPHVTDLDELKLAKVKIESIVEQIFFVYISF